MDHTHQHYLSQSNGFDKITRNTSILNFVAFLFVSSILTVDVVNDGEELNISKHFIVSGARKLYKHSKGIVNCQHTLDKGVPRMQQWPLDIPQ